MMCEGVRYEGYCYLPAIELFYPVPLAILYYWTEVMECKNSQKPFKKDACCQWIPSFRMAMAYLL